ncbi:hypothetical protein DH2020_016175 [Rehmannia glutinosa]|uniref:RING-type domain-containing protein n=1 Tax=Rehmannia glutinosa TaxID=99300 RepID=A0ABR0WUR3_REHGL
MNHQYAAMVTITFKKDDDGGGLNQLSLDFPTGLVVYAIIGILLMVIALIVKLLWNIDGDEGGGENPTATENSGLLSAKEEVLFSYYGSITSEEDLESGKGSCSSSSEDLYDGEICVICYDDQRNCFFVPCGHCISCHNCADR